MDNSNEKVKDIDLYGGDILRINEYIGSLKIKNKYKFLYEVSEFIDTFNFIDVVTIIQKLLSNDVLNSILKQCETDGTIDIANVSEAYKTNTFILIITMYCDLNDINLITDNYDPNEEFLKSKIDDTTKLYLKEMGRYPLLTPDEEKTLFTELKNGNEKVREKIINSNLRLVVSIAKRYVNKGLPFLDLIQEGNTGLMKAVDKFDVSKGYKFSTYATSWIMQTISKSIYDTADTIRIPVHQREKLSKLKKSQEKLYDFFGREPSIEELSNELDLPIDTIKTLLDAQAKLNPVSLYLPVGEDEKIELIDFIEDEDNILEERALRNLSFSELLDIMEKTKLNDREKDVICLRIGIYDDNPLSLEEVRKKYNVTGERIRQIEKRALEKLIIHMKRCGYYSEIQKEEKPTDLDMGYFLEFEKCLDFNKFDPSKMNPRFSDNTKMSSWFSSNMITLINSKKIKYALIQKQYKKYKDSKNNERKQKKLNERNNFFSLPNEFGIGKRVSVLPDFVMKGKYKMENVKNEFYSMFDESVEEVDNILENEITEKQKSIIIKKWGGDLKHPVRQGTKAFTPAENTLYYVAIKRVKQLLEVKHNKVNNDVKEETPITKIIPEEKEETNDTNEIHDTEASITPTIKVEKPRYDDNEAYLKIYELFNMPYFIHALAKIDPRDYKVLFLRLNYPDKSLDEISSFTGISKDKLLDAFSKGADELKIAINNLINEAFYISDSEEKKSPILVKDNM